MIPLLLFIIFLVWLNYKKRQTQQSENESRDQFWNRENQANTVPKQDISQLPYIKILPESLPFGVDSSSESTKAEAAIMALADTKILNLTGISNTDLKLKYGGRNLTVLTEYDQNFTILARNLTAWGKALYENGFAKEAITVLEFGITCRSDVTSNYTLLAQLYRDTDQIFKIQSLIDSAGQLNSLSKEGIIRHLSAYVHTEQ